MVSNLGGSSLHRTTYAEVERRSRRLARVLDGLGVGLGDRVATLAWNDFRHLELYYGVSGMGAVCHTVNPRLSADDIAYIMRDAADCVLSQTRRSLRCSLNRARDLRFSALVVLLTEPAGMKTCRLRPACASTVMRR